MGDGSLGEVKDEGYVVLRRGAGRSFLTHHGTGDICVLAGTWELQFEDGFAFVWKQGCEDEGVWASTLFKHALFNMPRPAAPGLELLIETVANTKEQAWRSDVFDSRCWSRSLKMSGTSQEHRLEAFVSHLARSGSYVRWAAPCVIDVVLGPSFPGDWICRRADRFRELLGKFGYLGIHIRDSMKSLMDTARVRGDDFDACGLTQVDREFGFTTEALLVLVCHLVHSKTKTPNGVDAPSRARNLINALAFEFLPDGECFIEIEPSEEGLAFQVISQKLGVKLRFPAEAKLDRALRGTLREELVDWGTFLLNIFGELKRPSVTGMFSHIVLGDVQQHMVGILAAEVEASKDDTTRWVAGAHVASVQLRRTAGKTNDRARRVSPTFKIEVHKAVAQEHGIRTSSQFLAARRILNRCASGSAANSLSRVGSTSLVRKKIREGVRFAESENMQYNMAGQRDFKQSRHAWYACDALRAANVDMLFVANGCPEKEIHMWSAPQAGNWRIVSGPIRNYLKFLVIVKLSIIWGLLKQLKGAVSMEHRILSRSRQLTDSQTSRGKKKLLFYAQKVKIITFFRVKKTLFFHFSKNRTQPPYRRGFGAGF